MTPDPDRSPSLPTPTPAPRDEATGLDPILPGAATPEMVFAAAEDIRRRFAPGTPERSAALTGAVPFLARLLESPDHDLRGDSAELLYQMLDVPGAADALNARMGDWVVAETVRRMMFEDAEFGICERAAALVPGLVAVLRAGPPEAREPAASALSQFKGSTLAPAVPALADALSDGDGPVRKCAAYALSDAEIADPTGVVPKVIAALASAGGDAGFVWALLQSLSRCGPAAAAAVPAVEAFLDSPDRNIGLDAAECLVRLGAGPRAIPFLRSVLHTAAGPLGRLAIQTAARVLPACGPEGVDALRSALSSARPETRRAAAEQLVPRDPSAVASLVRECLNSASAEERGWAADLCAKSRALIGLVFMDLLALTGTPDARFRHQVFRLLAQTRPPAAAVPAFVAMLEDSYRRYFAMERLADMGRDAAAAIPPLERLAASPAIGANKPLVRSAREAVQRIRADLAEGRPS